MSAVFRFLLLPLGLGIGLRTPRGSGRQLLAEFLVLWIPRVDRHFLLNTFRKLAGWQQPLHVLE
jgi:hypothetical protein